MANDSVPALDRVGRSLMRDIRARAITRWWSSRNRNDPMLAFQVQFPGGGGPLDFLWRPLVAMLRFLFIDSWLGWVIVGMLALGVAVDVVRRKRR